MVGKEVRKLKLTVRRLERNTSAVLLDVEQAS